MGLLVHTFVPQGEWEDHTPHQTERMLRMVRGSMQTDGNRGSVFSRSGWTAALALSYCEQMKIQHYLIAHPGQGYFVKAGEDIPVRWHPIAKDGLLPKEREVVMLTGDSGMMGKKQFLVQGYYDNKYRPELEGEGIRWLDIHGDALTDRGYHPSHWAHPVGLPPLHETNGSYGHHHQARKATTR